MKTSPAALLPTLLLGSALTASLMSVDAQADTVGLYVGAGQWQSDITGQIGSSTSNDLNASLSDLGYGSTDNNIVYVAFEHPVPILPNIRFDAVTISADSTAILDSDFQFDNIVHPAGIEISSKLDLTQYDGTLYYELLDNWVSLDLGLSVRKFEGEMIIGSLQTGIERSTADGYIPLLYSRVKFELPLTGLSFGAHAQGISYDDQSLTDFSANIAYMFDTSVIDLGLEAGYRQQKIELNELDKLNGDVTLEGPYASIIFHF